MTTYREQVAEELRAARAPQIKADWDFKRDRAHQLSAQGLTKRVIAMRLGVSRSWLNKVLPE